LGSKNEREEETKRLDEERKQLEKKVALGEIGVEDGPVCGSVQSDYDLDLRSDD
jgi:hypothetical protein